MMISDQASFLARKEYIGDGVYASFDGWHIVLTAENGIPSETKGPIFLEPGVLRALNGYAERIYASAHEEVKKMEDRE